MEYILYKKCYYDKAKVNKAIKAPLPQIQLVPVGGVDLNTTAEFIRAGAAAVGVGSALINQKLLDEGNFAEITRRAVRFREEVEKGRSQRG